MGVRKDDRVALWGYNSVNWLVAFCAIVRAGGVAVLVNYSTEIDDAGETALVVLLSARHRRQVSAT